MLYKPITVTVDALRRVLRATGTGDPHIALADGAVWTDPGTDQAADNAAWQTFAAAGLYDSSGLDPDLQDSLMVLSRPSVEYYGWITHEGVTTAALAAAIGGDAVLAIRRGQRIRLTPADPNRLAETLIGCLPRVAPGRGQSINLPVTAVRAGLASSRLPTVDVLDEIGPAVASRVAPFAHLAGLRATGAGELHTAARDRISARRIGSARPVGYQDTVEGRWLVQMVPSHDEDWVVAAPATPALLVTRLREAHRELAPRRS